MKTKSDEKSILTLALTMFVAETILTGCNAKAKKQMLLELKWKLLKKLYKKPIKITILSIENSKKSLTNKLLLTKNAFQNQKKKVKISKYKNDGNEKWESFKREFNYDMDKLGQSLKDLGENNVK